MPADGDLWDELRSVGDLAVDDRELEHALRQVRADLDTRIAAERRDRATPARTPGPSRYRRVIGPAAGVLAAAAAAGLVFITTDGPPAAPDASSSPSVILVGSLADAAGGVTGPAGGWPDLAHWQLRFRRVVADGTRTDSTQVLGNEVPGTLTTSIDGGPAVESATGPAAFTLAEQDVTWPALYALPTDPAALAEQLAGSSTAGDLLVQMVYVLAKSPASPELRRALFLAASKLGGVTDEGPGVDSAGRGGEWFVRSFPEHGTKMSILVSVSTGTVLETRLTATREFQPVRSPGAEPISVAETQGVPEGVGAAGRPALAPGDLIETTTYLESRPA